MEIAALGLRVDGARGINEAAESLGKLGAAAEKAEKNTGGVAVGSKKAKEALAEAAKSTQTFNNALLAAAGRAKTLALELGGVALAALSFRTATQTLAGFEQSMASVGAVTRASSKDMQAMREEAKRLGVATEFSASQAADGFMYLGLAGWDAQQSISAIPSVVDLATAASLGLADAANITSNIMSAYTIAAEEASAVTDILAGVSSRANTDVAQLGEAMKYVGPVAASLGISVGDTAAALGVLADASIQGGMGGTALRTVLTNMIKPTADAQKALASMGLTVSDINPVTNDFADIVQKLANKSITAEEAVRIFGLEGSSAILALTAAEPKLKSLTDETKRMGDEAKRMADAMRDNLRGDLLGLGSALEGVVISLGEAGLTGALRASAQAAAELLRETSALIDYLGRHLPAAAAVMAVTFGPKVFLAAAAGFKALSIAAVSAVRAITVAVAANPIGLLAVAAAMLLGEMYSLKDEVSAIGAVWDMLSDSVQWGWNILKDGAKTAFSMMGELGDRIVTVAGDFDLSWHGAFMAVTGGLDTWYGGVLGVVAGMGAAFRVLGENIGIIFSNAANKALSSINGMLDKISGPLKSLGIDLDLSLSHGSTDTKLKSITEEVKKAFDSQAGGFNLQEKYIKAYGLREIDRAMKDVEKWSESTADSVATVTEELNNNSRSLVDNSKKLSEAAKATKQNEQTIDGLAKSLYLAGLYGEELAATQARMSLNSYATPEQIEQVEALARATHQVQEAMSKRQRFGEGETADSYILGDANPLSGGAFDNQFARYAAEADAERKRYEGRLEILAEARDLKIETIRSYDELEAQIAQQHAGRMKQIDDARYSLALSSASSMFGDMASIMKQSQGEQSALYKTMFLAQKAFSIAQAVINTEEGATKALAMGPILGIPLSSFIRATGYASVGLMAAQTVAGMAHDGIDSVPQTGTWLLEKGERVTTAKTSARLDSTLERIDAKMRTNKSTGSATQMPAPIVNVIEDTNRAGQTEVIQNPDGGYSTNVFVSQIFSGGEEARALEVAYGLKRVGQ